MRILMLGWELPPHNSGGLGVVCYQLCRELARQGAKIDFLLPYRAEHGIDFMNVSAACPQDVVDIRKCGGAYASHNYVYADGREEAYDLFSQVRMYENAVKQTAHRKTFDAIHAHDWLTFRAGLQAKEASGRPLFVHVHSLEFDRAGGKAGNPLCHEIERLGCLAADRVFAVSEFTKKRIVEGYGIGADKVEVAYNSIDPDDVMTVNDSNSHEYVMAMRNSGYRVVVTVSRLTIQKGVSNLLRAIKKVLEHCPKTLFIVTGDGDQYHELVELSANLGIAKNVLFTGFLRDKKWRDTFRAGDLFVMPSVSEPFGITALESISLGTPALITRQSGISEILRNALKVDFWDIDEMANKIVGVIQNQSLRDTLQANAYQEFKHMGWGNTAQQILQSYHKYAMGIAA